MKLKIALIRHGEPEKASGPLSESGQKIIREKLEVKAYPKLKHVYTCELVCCRDTASLIYPFPAVVLRGLSMADSEDSYGQVLQNPLDKASLGMESLYDVNAKAGTIIRKIGAEMAIKKAERCALISCKMVILEILRRYCVPRSNYENWELPFGGGYLIEYDTVQETAKILSEI